jgi:hypothetical protein
VPLSKLDEYPLQQIESTFDHVEDSDRRWFERYWICVHDPAGETAIVHGIGVYPNANLIDGFASVVRGGVQRNVRAARMLDHERMDTFVGPLAVAVLRGLRTVRIALAPNEQEVAYELELEAEGSPLDRTRLPFLRHSDGRLRQKASMFAQRGRARGRLTIDGEEIAVDGWPYAKTNSWGIRSEPGPEPFLATPRRLVVGDPGELRVTTLIRVALAGGAWGAHDDFFDGLYRGDDAYTRGGRVTTDRETTPGGREATIVAIAVDGEREVGVLELGAG